MPIKTVIQIPGTAPTTNVKVSRNDSFTVNWEKDDNNFVITAPRIFDTYDEFGQLIPEKSNLSDGNVIISGDDLDKLVPGIRDMIVQQINPAIDQAYLDQKGKEK